MSWSTYGAFIVFVSVLILIPGPDVAVSMKNVLAGGKRQGVAAIVGIAAASLIQSTAAVTGLSVLITRAEPVFLAVKWAGAVYLCALGAQALRNAWRGDYPAEALRLTSRGSVSVGLRQGFLSNITNPKIIVFNLAVFPQFLAADAAPWTAALYAVSLPLLGSLYLAVLITCVHRARTVFAARRARRAMDTATGVALLGFGARLAVQ